MVGRIVAGITLVAAVAGCGSPSRSGAGAGFGGAPGTSGSGSFAPDRGGVTGTAGDESTSQADTGGSAAGLGGAPALGGASSGFAGARGGATAAAGTGSGATGTTAGAAGLARTGEGDAPGTGLPPEVSCPPVLVAPKPPVVLEATLGCEGSYGLAVTPTSEPDTVYVAVPVAGEDMYIAKIAPSGISIDAGGFDARFPILFLNDQGAPEIVAESESKLGLALWTPAQPNWRYEVISPGIAGPYGYYGLPPRSVVLQSNGEPRVLYGWLDLGERSPDGTWSETTINSDDNVGAAMVMDSLGRTRILYRNYSPRKFEEWVDGTLLDGYAVDTSDSTQFAVAIDRSTALGVARLSSDVIAMNFSDGTSVSADLVIDHVTPFSPEDCGHVSAFTCDSQGVVGVSLTATDDGTFWLAYLFRHKNFDFENSAGGSGTTITADHSTDEIRLFRVSPGGSPPPSLRWTYPVTYNTTKGINVVARGSRLFLGVEAAVTHVFELDSGQL